MPLQLATALGFVVSAIAFLGLPLVVLARIFDVYVQGVCRCCSSVLLIGGIQLITVGIIGEYVGRIYDEVKRRPLYVVSRRRNLADSDVDDVERPSEPAEIASP